MISPLALLHASVGQSTRPITKTLRGSRIHIPDRPSPFFRDPVPTTSSPFSDVVRNAILTAPPLYLIGQQAPGNSLLQIIQNEVRRAHAALDARYQTWRASTGNAALPASLTIVSWYRSFAQQATIVAGVLMSRGLGSTSDDAAVRAGMLESLRTRSVPGFSRHHWGTDIDVVTADSGAWRTNPALRAVEAFLRAEAPAFGFYNPYAEGLYPEPARAHYEPEPWHLSYAPIATALRERWLALFGNGNGGVLDEAASAISAASGVRVDVLRRVLETLDLPSYQRNVAPPPYGATMISPLALLHASMGQRRFVMPRYARVPTDASQTRIYEEPPLQKITRLYIPDNAWVYRARLPSPGWLKVAAIGLTLGGSLRLPAGTVVDVANIAAQAGLSYARAFDNEGRLFWGTIPTSSLEFFGGAGGSSMGQRVTTRPITKTFPARVHLPPPPPSDPRWSRPPEWPAPGSLARTICRRTPRFGILEQFPFCIMREAAGLHEAGTIPAHRGTASIPTGALVYVLGYDFGTLHVGLQDVGPTRGAWTLVGPRPWALARYTDAHGNVAQGFMFPEVLVRA